MQALCLTRPHLSPSVAATRSLIRRRLATTASPSHAHVSAASSSSSSATATTTTTARSQQQSIIPLSNVEAQWEKLSKEDQVTVHAQLEALQKKDWKTLSVDEKKAAYYVAFGPHGPRAPVSPPGQGLKIFLSTMALVGVAGVLSLVIKSFAAPPPKTLTKEWQEASNERAREQKMNPISGISSEGYKGKGFVTHK